MCLTYLNTAAAVTVLLCRVSQSMLSERFCNQFVMLSSNMSNVSITFCVQLVYHIVSSLDFFLAYFFEADSLLD